MVDGKRLLFGFHGIWQGTAVLYDRGTQSLWMHFTGKAIEGPLAGRRLEVLDTGRHTRWREWRTAHPDTDVMRPDPRYTKEYFPRQAARAGEPFLSGPFRATIQTRDPRLGLSDLLLGVRVGSARRAYPYDRLARGDGVVEERVGDVDLTVWYDVDSRSAAAFDRRHLGVLLSFVREGRGRFRDRETGSVWDMEGTAVEGSRKGDRLGRVESLQSEWFGWYAHHPDTTLWGP